MNSVVDATIARESQYTRKGSTCIESEARYQAAVDSCSVGGEIPTNCEKFNAEVDKSVKTALCVENRDHWETHVKSLVVQGQYLALAAAEKQDVVWKGFMFNMKQGTLKFLLNASIDTLPTAANLKRWKKSSSDFCKLCKRRETTNHVLNGCKVSLDTGRFTWRHNCIVNYIVNSVDSKYTVYSDLPGHTAAGGGSIPPEMCVTAEKPDIVILDNHKKQIHLFELTCPSEKYIDTRNTEKSNKYAHFLTDITQFKSTVNCFEVSSKGFISTRNHTTLNTLYKFTKPGITKSQFKSNISALSITASHHIFICRKEPTFLEPPFLLPPLVDRTRGSS